MAIADTITSMQNHTSNAYTMIGYGTDLTGINKNLENLSTSIFNAFLEALRTPDTLFTNLPKKSGTGANITLNDTANAPMRIELGATELTQDGTPTPSSPQDIHTISGDNTIRVCGKNLFDKSDAILGKILRANDVIENSGTAWYKPSYIKVEPNTQYVALNCDWTSVLFYDINKIYLSISTLRTGTPQFTTPNNCHFIRVTGSQSLSLSEGSYLQIEKGTASTYEPYNGTDYSVNLGNIEYCKIGTYEDEFIRETDGTWQLKKNIGKVVLDGTENWETQWLISSGNDTNGFRTTISDILIPTSTSETPNLLSNYFSPETQNYTSTHSGYICRRTNQTQIIATNNDIATIEAFKTWLSTHNTEVWYPLATPTYTKITGTLANQLEQVYKNMLSQEGVTNISQINNDLSFALNVQAIEELA